MIDYSYNIIKVDLTAKVMEIVYTAPGRATVHMSARLPYEGETLESVIRMYSPEMFWLEQATPVIEVQEGITGEIVNSVPPPVTLDDVKKSKLLELANRRYAAEVAGVVVSGSLIRTDRESQATLTSAYVTLQAGFKETIDWKTSSGDWIALTLQEVTYIASIVTDHVQSCFTTERALSDQVLLATTIEEVNSISWPN